MEARYSFEQESDHLNHIAKVIVYLLKYMDEHPVAYPPAMLVYATLRFGLVPNIQVACEHDEECTVSAKNPCGGLSDVLEALEKAYECLELELDLEQVYEYPADYSI